MSLSDEREAFDKIERLLRRAEGGMSEPITDPRDVPGAHAIIRRLCALQAHVVSEVAGYDDPADCFCGDEGFWPLADADDYRNAGKAIDFIETATLDAIKRQRPTREGEGGAE